MATALAASAGKPGVKLLRVWQDAPIKPALEVRLHTAIGELLMSRDEPIGNDLTYRVSVLEEGFAPKRIGTIQATIIPPNAHPIDRLTASSLGFSDTETAGHITGFFPYQDYEFPEKLMGKKAGSAILAEVEKDLKGMDAVGAYLYPKDERSERFYVANGYTQPAPESELVKRFD